MKTFTYFDHKDVPQDIEITDAAAKAAKELIRRVPDLQFKSDEQGRMMFAGTYKSSVVGGTTISKMNSNNVSEMLIDLLGQLKSLDFFMQSQKAKYN